MSVVPIYVANLRSSVVTQHQAGVKAGQAIVQRGGGRRERERGGVREHGSGKITRFRLKMEANGQFLLGSPSDEQISLTR